MTAGPSSPPRLSLSFGVHALSWTAIVYMVVFGAGCASVPLDSDLSGAPTQKPRVVVTTDGEVDDRSSLVRLLLYTPDFDVDGIIATNSVWQKDGHGTGWILDLIEDYEQVRPNLLLHDPRYPEADHLRSLVMLGNEDRNRMHRVGPENDTPGSQHIIEVLLDEDERPVWLQAWGGTNTIAQAFWRLRESYSAADFQRAASKARVYAIADQDSTIWWLRDEVPEVPVILNYQFTAINYQHEGHPYSSDPMFSTEWMREHVKEGHGVLGAAYPQAYFSEGDSPAFFHVIDTGLRSTEHLSFGGWGGRFVKDDPSYPNFWRDAQDDEDRLKPLWRWLPAIQNDFAARMDWSVRPYSEANHPPIAALAGTDNRTVRSGETVHLDARASTDPDGDPLAVRWWVYSEAGSHRGHIALGDADSPRTDFTAPQVVEPETVHVILEVTDRGEPALTRYRRIVVTVLP